MKWFNLIFVIFLLSYGGTTWSQPADLDLEDPEDLELLMDDIGEDDLDDESLSDSSDSAGDEFEEEFDEEPEKSPKKQTKKKAKQTAKKESSGDSISDDISEDLEEIDFDEQNKAVEAGKADDLDALMEDIGQIEFSLPEEKEDVVKDIEIIENKPKAAKKSGIKIYKDGSLITKEAALIFEVGKLEKDLLEMAKNMQGKIPNNEWNEIAGKSTDGSYEVVEGDWLWKISQKIFGSGFYYSKIWALNPYITNPHEIEPGMILSFSTGSDNNLPLLKLQKARKRLITKRENLTGFDRFGDDTQPDWIKEREDLIEKGVFLQYSTGDTQKDLKEIGDESLINEYEAYEPPRADFYIEIPSAEFDESGFDKNSKISYNYKEGFYLNTFISDNIVQDFGKIESGITEQSLFSTEDTVFVRFDENIDVVVGDKFSAYSSGGVRSHPNSDRKGFQYTISGSLEVVQKHEGLYECKVLEIATPLSRGDRITVYTPKIERISKSFNSRLIEAILLGSYRTLQNNPSMGDVVYIDRGRADGVEVGNVFEVYGFKDRGTGEFITPNPTYKNGELIVITVTDNFSTALVTNSKRDFIIGDLVVSKTKEAAARTLKLKNKLSSADSSRLTNEAMEDLDVELNLDDLNDSLLDKADQIQFTEDELAELERQEREKSILTENEKDLRSLERLEGELETAEKMLNEARLDEDKLLEEEDLNKVENKFSVEQQESLDEIEENFGQRYLDEDLNDKENPYGLTEFDIEEVDELLNAEKIEEQ